MENVQSAKRQKLEVEPQWGRMEGRQLPPLPQAIIGGSPGRHPYTHPTRSMSSPRPHYSDGGSNYHEQNKPLPIPMQESRQPPGGHLVYNHQSNEVNPVKRESDANHDHQYRQPLPSSRPPENGQHRSPQSYNVSPHDTSYEQPNGSAVIPYHIRAGGGIPPPSLSMNGIRTHYDRYAQSPDAPATADGLFSPNNSYGLPPPNNPGKKKAQRASQACDSCRSLKAKCDESKPCQSCKDKGIECTYRQPEPKAQDRIQAEMSEGIKKLVAGFKSMDEILKGVTAMRDSIDKLTNRIERLEQRSYGANHIRTTSPEAPTEAEEIEHQGQIDFHSSHKSDNAHRSESSFAIIQSLQQTEPMETDTEAVSDEEMAPPLNPKKPKFGIQHTTGAVEILKWQPISELVIEEVRNDRVDKGKGPKTDRYLWKAEKRRGELRTHGYGEGVDYRGLREYMSDASDSLSATSSPPPFSEPPFGAAHVKTSYQLPGFVKPLKEEQVGEFVSDSKSHYQLPAYTVIKNSKEEQTGGLISDGTLDLRPRTVKRLVASYMAQMNILHPILTQREVDKLVAKFLKEIKPVPDVDFDRKKQQPSKKYELFIGQNATQILGKRSRSTPERGEHGDRSSSPDISTQAPERSPNNAVVLLMLALGKICEYKQKLPEATWGIENASPTEIRAIRGSGPVSPDPSCPSSPTSSVEHTSPHSQQTITTHSQQTAPGLPQLTTSRFLKEEQSNISGKRRPLKNQDVLPGMAYAAVATDIIGNQLSGSTMCHIQANLLASLYYGQLVRPVQSHAHLHVASRAIQDSIRLKSTLAVPKPGTLLCEPKDNPLVYAFWTCLQLECDIVAELGCVHSGILGFEESMPYPNTPASVQYDKMSQVVAWSYDAQLWLRKHLNDIHAHYSPLDPQSTFHLFKDKKQQPKQFSSIEAVETARTAQFGRNEYLQEPIWPALHWNFEDDRPALAIDILSARTRAKFYGARVITYRPFVEAILRYSWNDRHGFGNENHSTANVDPKSLGGVIDGILGEIPKPWQGLPGAPMEEKIIYSYSEAHLKYFKRGILALINSTTAFHGMGTSRLIVTNVFGTVHAQWGNVLVLLAVYNDVSLRHILINYIPEIEFKELVLKTLRFLSEVAQKESGLQIDIKILKAAAIKANVLKPDEFGIPSPPSHRDSSAFTSTPTTFTSNDPDTPR